MTVEELIERLLQLPAGATTAIVVVPSKGTIARLDYGGGVVTMWTRPLQ